MIRTMRAARTAAALLIVAGALSLAGCDGGVQLNGKIFDAMGMSGDGSSSAEPKLQQRSGLVVPPSTEALPVPGSRPDGEAADLAALNDPDKLAKVSEAEQQRQQEAYCKVNYEQARQRGDQNADLAEGPLGPCKGSVLTALKQWQSGGDDKDE